MACTFRLIAFFLVFLVSFNSFASFPAASSLKYQVSFVGNVIGEFDNFADIQPFLVSRTLAAYPSATGPYSLELNSSLANPGDQSSGKFRYFLNGSSYSSNYSFKYVSISFCPAGSSASGSVCTCNEGLTELGGQCLETVPPEYCPDGQEFIGGQCVNLVPDNKELEKYCSDNKDRKFDTSISVPVSGDSRPKTDFVSVCDIPQAIGGGAPLYGDSSKGCFGIFDYSYAASSGNGVWDVYGSMTYTGGACTPGPPLAAEGDDGPPDAPKLPETKPATPDCLNGQKGMYNGVTVCIPYSKKTNKGDSSETTNPDGSKDKTESVTTCQGNKCVTTTTVTHTTSENISATTVTNTESDKGSYCSRNPAEKVCSDEGGSFAGSCAAGFSCSGDVLQCVLAKEQHKRNCQIFESTGDELNLYNASKGKEGDQTGGLSGNRSVDMSSPGIFRSDAMLGSGTCIQDISVEVMTRTVQLPLSYICPWVNELRYVLLALGGLYWLVIVFKKD